MATVRVLITISDIQLVYLDALCKKEIIGRSQLVRLALGEYIRNHPDGISLPQTYKQEPVMATALTLHRCEYPSPKPCKVTKTGEYDFNYVDNEGNLQDERKYFCEEHYLLVRKTSPDIKPT